MSVVPRYLLIPLRLGQLAFSAIVTGVIGYFISLLKSDPSDFNLGRWIYVEALAGVSVIFALIFLLPTFLAFFVWPIDIVISLAWFAAFGLMFDALDGVICDDAEGFGPVSDTGNCATWEVAEAFSFISAVTWLVTGFLGLYLVWRADAASEYGKRRWHGAHDV